MSRRCTHNAKTGRPQRRIRLVAGLALVVLLPAPALMSGSQPGDIVITVPEGLSLSDIYMRLGSILDMDPGSFAAVNGDPEMRRQLAGFEVPSLEGLIMPMTYTLPGHWRTRQPEPEVVLATIMTASRRALRREFLRRPVDAARSEESTGQGSFGLQELYKALIIASLIEKETADPAERPLVSSVIHNRLKLNWKLELCSSLLYVLPEGRIAPNSVDLSNLSPYNTYRHRGLPPSPICSPGLPSIHAALNPADTDLLFFRLDDDGRHRFAQDYDDHQRLDRDPASTQDSGSLESPSPGPRLSGLSLEEKIGQMVIVGFHGTDLTRELSYLINTGHVGGFVFYNRNFPDGELALQRLITKLRRQAGDTDLPLLMCIDQEGGTVNRISYGGEAFPSAALLGTRSPEFTYRIARESGKRLKDIGIDLNFAPVLDLHYPAYTDFFRTRSFSADLEVVAEHGDAFVRGLISSGIFPVVKHFPGQGMGRGDLHLRSITINRDLSRLQEEDLFPFRSVIGTHTVGVMVNHAVYPLIDGTAAPASRSRVIMEELLRRDIGYSGPIFVDEIEMLAFSPHSSIYDGAIESIRSGADVLLVGHSFETQRRLIDELILVSCPANN